MPDTILVLNAGSSSIKFELFALGPQDALASKLAGQIEGIAEQLIIQSDGSECLGTVAKGEAIKGKVECHHGGVGLAASAQQGGKAENLAQFAQFTDCHFLLKITRSLDACCTPFARRKEGQALFNVSLG